MEERETTGERVRAALRWQADYCRRSGSPIVGAVCAALAEVLGEGSVTGRRALGWAGDPVQDALPLRIAAPFHALHRAGRAPALDPVYGGTDLSPATVAAAVAAVLAEHDHEIAGWMDGPPQTNEPGRSAVLMAGLLAVAAEYPQTTGFELLEIGSSAGLNLMIGRYGFDLNGLRFGPEDAAIRIAPEWRGFGPPDRPRWIDSAAGCDVAPIDLTDRAQADRLLAYVWPDQPGRMARMEAAVAAAQARPPRLEQGDAADWLKAQLKKPQVDGQARVLMHSVVWPYLPPATQARIEALMTQAGARATVERPLGWLSYEWTGGESRRHALRLRTWPAPGTDRILAYVHAHGAWIEWLSAAGD
ncbi:MAG: hypothetical protein JWN59_1671, partial [Sphingomonas bacterium]|nr:hypothetical protein [Sphingomonas bacterium]